MVLLFSPLEVEAVSLLTVDERAVLRNLAEGHETAELPGLLYTDMKHVRELMDRLFYKLDVGSVEELRFYHDLLKRLNRLDKLYAEQGGTPV